jgi:hypothetical protein
LQTSGRDAVDALLVFLNLLERHASRLGEIGLRQLRRHAVGADAAADLNV